MINTEAINSRNGQRISANFVTNEGTENADDNMDQSFSDGNTGATKETFKVSKKQLKEQA